MLSISRQLFLVRVLIFLGCTGTLIFYFLASACGDKNTTKYQSLLLRNNSSLPNLDNSSSSVQEARSCTPQELATGKWVRAEVAAPPYQPPDDWTKSSACYKTANLSTISPWITHHWVPEEATCQFRSFEPDLFCKRFANQTISMIGDSLTFEMYESLVYLMGGMVVDNEGRRAAMVAPIIRKIQRCGNMTLTYRRDDSLALLKEELDGHHPDMIILNRGAHFVKNVKFMQGVRRNIQELNMYQRECQGRNQTCEIVVRLTVPGHPACADQTEPSHSLEDIRRRIANQSLYSFHPKGHTFYWWEMERQNAMVVAAYNQSNVTHTILDAVNMLLLRPDLHRVPDCLHSCYPGPMDYWNQLLFHLFV